jgi:hypothetical protein
MIELPQMIRIRAKQWMSFLITLIGREGTFVMGGSPPV